jgi:glycerol-3-phosphate acyltransferase PlsY
MKTVAVVLLVSYLVGAIPWSWLLVRLRRGVDLRQVGSGNLGATYTYRALGAPAAVLVLVLDILKGWIAPVGFARLRLDAPAFDPALLPACAGFAAIAGHIFPPYLRFRGGKGIATSAGVFLALEPRALVIAFAAFLVGVVATRGIVSVGSLLGALVLPFAVYGLQSRALEPAWGTVAVAAAVTLLLFVKHTANIRRLVRGEEKRIFGSRGARPDAASQPGDRATALPKTSANVQVDSPAVPRGGDSR